MAVLAVEFIIDLLAQGWTEEPYSPVGCHQGLS